MHEKVGGQTTLIDPALEKVGGQLTPLTPCFRGLCVVLTDLLSQSVIQARFKLKQLFVENAHTGCNKNNTHTITFFTIRSMNFDLHLRPFQCTLFTLLNHLR